VSDGSKVSRDCLFAMKVRGAHDTTRTVRGAETRDPSRIPDGGTRRACALGHDRPVAKRQRSLDRKAAISELCPCAKVAVSPESRSNTKRGHYHAIVIAAPMGKAFARTAAEAEAGGVSSTTEWRKYGTAKPIPAPTRAPTTTSVNQCSSAAMRK
jgi:hypothetical protein